LRDRAQHIDDDDSPANGLYNDPRSLPQCRTFGQPDGISQSDLPLAEVEILGRNPRLADQLDITPIEQWCLTACTEKAAIYEVASNAGTKRGYCEGNELGMNR